MHKQHVVLWSLTNKNVNRMDDKMETQNKLVANIQVGQTINEDWKVLAVKPVSMNPLDNYLQIILCEKETEYGTKFVTWLYNAYGGCNGGHYYDAYLEKLGYGLDKETAYKDALNDFNQRT